MRDVLRHRVLLSFILLVVAHLFGSAAQAQFLETWESPAIAAGTQTTAAGYNNWVAFGGSTANMVVQYPNTTVSFNQVQALAEPAGGNQLLRLPGPNTGISRMSGIIIEAGRKYSLSAAIGNSKSDASSATWSLQLWADANHNGVFEGGSGDTFIG